jgi:hypothetical protein
MQTWPKFGPGMGHTGHVGPVASHSWGGRWRRVSPVGPIQTRADAMHRSAEDALISWYGWQWGWKQKDREAWNKSASREGACDVGKRDKYLWEDWREPWRTSMTTSKFKVQTQLFRENHTCDVLVVVTGSIYQGLIKASRSELGVIMSLSSLSRL